MFRSLRDSLETALNHAIDNIAQFFGGKEQPEAPAVAFPPEPIVSHESAETIEDTDWIEEEDYIEDADEDDDDFDRYIDELDRSSTIDNNYQEVRTLESYRGDPEALRVVRYTSYEEAQNFLDDAGLSAFAEVLYVEEEDTFTIAVYDSPGAT